MYGIEGSACDIVGTFRRPGKYAPLPPPRNVPVQDRRAHLD